MSQRNPLILGSANPILWSLVSEDDFSRSCQTHENHGIGRQGKLEPKVAAETGKRLGQMDSCQAFRFGFFSREDSNFWESRPKLRRKLFKTSSESCGTEIASTRLELLHNLFGAPSGHAFRRADRSLKRTRALAAEGRHLALSG